MQIKKGRISERWKRLMLIFDMCDYKEKSLDKTNYVFWINH